MADAFDGVRVVELAQWVFVPVAGALLADWGADVIRIDRPEGDPYRGPRDPGHRHRQRRRQPVGRAGQPRQALDRARPAHRGRARGPASPARARPTCSSPASGPARSSASASAPTTSGERYPRLVYARGHGYGVRGPDAELAGLRRVGVLGPRRRRPRAHPARPRLPDLASAVPSATATAAMALAFGIAAALLRRATHRRGLGRRRVAARHRDVDAVVRRARPRCRARSPARCRAGGRCVNPLGRRPTARRTAATSRWCSSSPTGTGRAFCELDRPARPGRRPALRRPPRPRASTPRSASRPLDEEFAARTFDGVEGAARRDRRAVGADAGGRGAARRSRR